MILKQKQYDYIFYSILAALVVVLVFVSNTLSISYKEALNVFVNTSVLSYITNISLYILGQNDVALRLPFLIFYFLSVLLMYKMTSNYYKYEQDRFIATLIFMILPGVLSASLLVNSAIIVTFFTMLYIYIYEKRKEHSYIFLLFLLFLDNSSAILFLAIFFIAIKSRDKKLIYYTLLLFSLSMYIYGFETQGKPKGYFLDTFAIYATIFSPLLFIYFIYCLYRDGIKGEKSLTWYISTTALLLSLLFSFRQRIYIEDFAPYVIISLPFVLKHFFHAYRVRLTQFRKNHKIAAILTIGMLLFNVILTIVNKPLYLFLPDVKKHFVYKYHFVKEIAQELKKENINYVNSDNKELLLRLRFYGIKNGNKYFLTYSESKDYIKYIEIKYLDKKLLHLYIKKEDEKINNIN